VEQLHRDHGVPALAQMAAGLAPFLDLHGAEVAPSIRARLEPYRGWGPAKVARLVERVKSPLRRMRESTEHPILLPTLPCVPPRIGTAVSLGTLTKFGNLLGESSVSVPIYGREVSLMLFASELPLLLGFAKSTAGMCA
jgi:hypothetical protein